LFRLRPSITRAGVKSAELVALGILIGVLDDLQVRYVDIEQFGNGPEIAYQAAFMAAAAAGAFLVLRNSEWSKLRNLANLLVAVPLASMADNVSIDAGTLRPYILFIPSQGFEWRQAVFARVPALSQTAVWVNRQTVTSGLINGYVVAIIILAGYLLLQFAWSRQGRAATTAMPQSVA
jgi:hypothetical protein